MYLRCTNTIKCAIHAWWIRNAIKSPLVFLRLFLRPRCARCDRWPRGEFIALPRDIAESSRTNLAPVRDKRSCESTCVWVSKELFFICTLSVRSEPGQGGGGGFSLWLWIKFLINSGSWRGVKIFLTCHDKKGVNGVAQNRLAMWYGAFLASSWWVMTRDQNYGILTSILGLFESGKRIRMCVCGVRSHIAHLSSNAAPLLHFMNHKFQLLLRNYLEELFRFTRSTWTSELWKHSSRPTKKPKCFYTFSMCQYRKVL